MISKPYERIVRHRSRPASFARVYGNEDACCWMANSALFGGMLLLARVHP